MEYTRRDHERYLNELHNIDTVLELTEHCWAGNDKSFIDKKCAKAYAYRGHYGTILRQFDKIAFNVSYQEKQRNQKQF